MPLLSRRNRSAAEPVVADVARRRLADLRAQLAAERGEEVPAPGDAPARSETPAPGRHTEAEPRTKDVASAPGLHARRPVGPLRRCRDWCADRVPAVLGARPGLGSAQVGLVCLVVAVGLVAATWWAMLANGSGGTVAPPRVTGAHLHTAQPSASPTDPSSTQPAAASGGGQGGKIVVDVVGRVVHRGIVVLPAGSRVVDAVRAAGGLRTGVNRAEVNFARVLTDGEQLVVGEGGAPVTPGTAPSSTASPATLVNINTADQATLETLPGIGPVTATAILQWRDEHGFFSTVDELLEVDGIGEATLADIAPLVTL
jgi:competence protein ComEA